MTVIFVVFISFGCVFFLALALFAFCCFIKKCKCSKTTEKSEMVHVDEHLKVSENILQAPNGMKTVAITIDDDLHVHEKEERAKNEKLGKGYDQRARDAPSTSSQA
ncbi:tracheary element differentiation-related 6 [Artemisia annua]|uniref:Tracheary element differentiation-related 6 n=1 Tax=Artemisia annua TaxID=35608 RepID=A0A2U1KW95_ARTAN|nr:tracheary element differentiation-related 6 [Artemisia annua]